MYLPAGYVEERFRFERKVQLLSPQGTLHANQKRKLSSHG
jgi:hypothetical protein